MRIENDADYTCGRKTMANRIGTVQECDATMLRMEVKVTYKYF
jgi:hypothetical protein